MMKLVLLICISSIWLTADAKPTNIDTNIHHHHTDTSMNSLNQLIDTMMQGIFRKEMLKWKEMSQMQQQGTSRKYKYGCECKGLKCDCCIHHSAKKQPDAVLGKKGCLRLRYSDKGDFKLNITVDTLVGKENWKHVVLTKVLTMNEKVPELCIADHQNRMHCIHMTDLQVKDKSLAGCAHVITTPIASPTTPSTTGGSTTAQATVTSTAPATAADTNLAGTSTKTIVQKRSLQPGQEMKHNFGCFRMMEGSFSSQSSITVMQNSNGGPQQPPLKVSVKIEEESAESDEMDD